MTEAEIGLYRAGIAVGIDAVVQMVAPELHPTIRDRLIAWQENVLRWCFGEDVAGWSPPHRFHMPCGIEDCGIPQPQPRFRPDHRPQVDVIGARFSNATGAPPPEWAGQTRNVFGGKIQSEIDRERHGPHAEDSERP